MTAIYGTGALVAVPLETVWASTFWMKLFRAMSPGAPWPPVELGISVSRLFPCGVTCVRTEYDDETATYVALSAIN